MSSASRGSTGSASIPSRVLEMIAEAASNASVSVCTIRNTMRPVSALTNVLTTHGRRARVSRSIPFKRRDEPSVADGGSVHSATNDGPVPRSDVRSGAVKIAVTMPVINLRKEPCCLSAESMSHFRSPRVRGTTVRTENNRNHGQQFPEIAESKAGSVSSADSTAVRVRSRGGLDSVVEDAPSLTHATG